MADFIDALYILGMLQMTDLVWSPNLFFLNKKISC